MGMPGIDPEVLDVLARYGSATAQNAGVVVRGFVPEDVDYTGPELRCFIPGKDSAIVGFAFTGQMMPLHAPQQALDWNVYYDELADLDGPSVVVLQDIDEPAGRAACVGDVMARRFRALGARCAIVGGSIRDLGGIQSVGGFGLWATGRSPGHGPFNIVNMNCPVEVAGLRIAPNDLLVADEDGVTRVPLDEAAAVAEACLTVHEKEERYHRHFSKPGYSKADHEDFKRMVAAEAARKAD